VPEALDAPAFCRQPAFVVRRAEQVMGGRWTVLGGGVTKRLDTALCACGSGLRRVRCCDMDAGALPDAAALALLDDKANEATKLFNDKKAAEAETLAKNILDLAPNHRIALRVLFEIRKATGKLAAAEVLARRLARLPAATPALDAAANLQLAQLVIGQGRHADAEAAARRAVTATPRDPTAHHVMGVTLTETARVPAGERHYRRALALLGREDGTVLANLAWNLKLQGRLQEAAAAYERALALRPDNSRGVGGYAQVAAGLGDTDKAIALLNDGVKRWPEDRALRLLRALTDLVRGNAAAVIDRLGDKPEDLLPAELSARGQAVALLGRPVEAVGLFALGKKMQRERYGQTYQPEALLRRAEAYKAYFTADRVLNLPRTAPAPGPQPIFLLGFPRSGTSLLEQLLAQVPGIAAGDDFAPVEPLTELVPKLADQPEGEALGYPAALDSTLVGDGLDTPSWLRARHARQLAAIAGAEQKFVTDRSPANAWHLGLIKLLYPEAPIIHVIRHPFDLMLSNLAQERRLEGNCGVSMVALAKHYELTMSMIRHFRGQLTLRYLPVRYEQLVTDPKGTLAHVLNFCGADAGAAPAEAALWENRAVRQRLVPAHMAARGAIHEAGRYRYRRYEAVLPNLFTEIRPVLAPWIDELGYGAAP
jgi:Flp pilus assembly protein TadD